MSENIVAQVFLQQIQTGLTFQIHLALDNTLMINQMKCSLPTLMCGDLRQILPVVREGTRANVADACPNRSKLWQNVTIYNLKDNNRLSVEIQALRCFRDKDLDPDLSEIILTNMIHGPYGHTKPSAPCMKDEKCSESFPRSFIQNTETGTDSYPNYRRRSPGEGGKNRQWSGSFYFPAGCDTIDRVWNSSADRRRTYSESFSK